MDLLGGRMVTPGRQALVDQHALIRGLDPACGEPGTAFGQTK
jgi:hypothetical protein